MSGSRHHWLALAVSSHGVTGGFLCYAPAGAACRRECGVRCWHWARGRDCWHKKVREGRCSLVADLEAGPWWESYGGQTCVPRGVGLITTWLGSGGCLQWDYEEEPWQ